MTETKLAAARVGDTGMIAIRHDEAIISIKKLLSFLTDRNVPMGYASTPAHLIIEYGREYHVTDRTFEGKRGTPQSCYANAGRLALEGDGLTYVEGYVTFAGIPIEHAWVIDGDGNVIEPTLKPEGVVGYYGVAFDTNFLRLTVLRTKMWGIICPDSNIALFKDGLPADALAKV